MWWVLIRERWRGEKEGERAGGEGIEGGGEAGECRVGMVVKET